MTELKPCPVCGGIAEVYIGEKDLWKVGCADCRIFATDEKKDKAIRLWNEVNSKEVKADSALRPCPFCGGQVEMRDVMDGRNETFAFHCISCHINFTKFDWVARDRKDVIKEWNRRVKE